MNPGQSVSFTVNDSVSCNAMLGDTLWSYAQILPLAADCNAGNNYMEEIGVVTGSFDPNEKKAVTTSNKIAATQGNILPTDTITYTITFQNTGTDTAFTVTIFDEIDPSLDISSFVSGVSSHPYTLQILGTNVLKWTFNNILLPDSNVNEPASHGFIKFKIQQKPNNPIWTYINNHAGIVFDYNTAVNTDTVVLVVNTPTAIEESKGDNNVISIYPNPTAGAFTIKTENEKITYIKVYNVLGEVVYEAPALKGANTISVSLPSGAGQGIYFLHIKTEQGVAVKKIIRQ